MCPYPYTDVKTCRFQNSIFYLHGINQSQYVGKHDILNPGHPQITSDPIFNSGRYIYILRDSEQTPIFFCFTTVTDAVTNCSCNIIHLFLLKRTHIHTTSLHLCINVYVHKWMWNETIFFNTNINLKQKIIKWKNGTPNKWFINNRIHLTVLFLLYCYVNNYPISLLRILNNFFIK